MEFLRSLPPLCPDLEELGMTMPNLSEMNFRKVMGFLSALPRLSKIYAYRTGYLSMGSSSYESLSEEIYRYVRKTFFSQKSCVIHSQYAVTSIERKKRYYEASY
jgi:hypothetical protein